MKILKALIPTVIITFIIASNVYAGLNSKLLKAIKYNNVNEVKNLLSEGANPNTGDLNGTALMQSASEGYARIAKLLIDNGADVNSTDSVFHETALMLAASKGYTKVAKLLIDKGVNINATDSLVHETALMLAESKGYMKMVILLVDNGANVNIKDRWGHTALFYAIQNHHTEIARFLKMHGAMP